MNSPFALRNVPIGSIVHYVNHTTTPPYVYVVGAHELDRDTITLVGGEVVPAGEQSIAGRIYLASPHTQVMVDLWPGDGSVFYQPPLSGQEAGLTQDIINPKQEASPMPFQKKRDLTGVTHFRRDQVVEAVEHAAGLARESQMRGLSARHSVFLYGPSPKRAKLGVSTAARANEIRHQLLGANADLLTEKVRVFKGLFDIDTPFASISPVRRDVVAGAPEAQKPTPTPGLYDWE